VLLFCSNHGQVAQRALGDEFCRLAVAHAQSLDAQSRDSPRGPRGAEGLGAEGGAEGHGAAAARALQRHGARGVALPLAAFRELLAAFYSDPNQVWVATRSNCPRPKARYFHLSTMKILSLIPFLAHRVLACVCARTFVVRESFCS
jgi:hypothetical protein